MERALGSGKNSTKKIAALREDKDFERLMKLLDGYPLAMEVVLANLARQNAGEILAGLDVADVALDRRSVNKTESILKCVEYSHSNLSESAQKLLLCLAPFKGFIYRPLLPNYAQQLQQLAPFESWDFERFDDAIDEAVRWGLLSPYFEGDDGRLLRMQPVFPYFLKTKLAEADEAIRDGLATGFKEQYKGLAAQYQQMMESKEPEQRKLGLFFCGLEYENLFSALQTCLVQQETFEIFFCLNVFFNSSNDTTGKLDLAEYVNQLIRKYPSHLLKGEFGLDQIGTYDLLASSQLRAKQYESAKNTYLKELSLLNNISSVDEQRRKLQIAVVNHQLGRVAQELRGFEQARSHFQQALDIKIEFSDRYAQAKTYHMLGIVAQELRDFEQARSHFQHALDIKIEFNDRYSQAVTYHMLGIVAQELRDFEQARSHFQQALDIQIEFNDRYEQAKTYHMLGIVAQELRDFEQARSHFQQALDIQIEFSDRYSQAGTYHMLGIVAQELRDFEQARSHFQQALDIYIEFSDRYEQAGTYNQLGEIERAQENYTEAKALLLKALEIFAEFSDEHNASIVFNNLKAVYQATQDDALLSAVAALINASPEEVHSRFIAAD